MQRALVFVMIISVSAILSCQIDIRPPKGPHPAGKHSAHHDCLEKCKGLKGHERAECNKECNRKHR